MHGMKNLNLHEDLRNEPELQNVWVRLP